MLFRSGLLELLSSLGLVSKIVLLILLIFSIGSWTVILYKWRFFRRQEAADLRFLKTYRRNESPLAASRDLHLHRDRDRKSTRLNSSHLVISYAVFCLKKKKKKSLTVTR